MTIKMYFDELSLELIKRGEDGRERTNKHFKEHGYLAKTGNTHGAFLKKVKQYYEVIKISSHGAKRIYHLVERDTFITRKKNGKGHSATNEETLLKELVFNALLKHQKSERVINDVYDSYTTYNKWIKHLGLTNFYSEYEKKEYKSELIQYIENSYKDVTTSKNINAASICEDFNSKQCKIKINMFKSALKRLKKENRISISRIYRDKNYNVVEDKIKDEMDINRDKILNELDVSIQTYNLIKSKTNKDPKKIISKIEESNFDLFGHSYVYECFDFKIINETIYKENISNDLFTSVVIKKLLKSTKSNQNKILETDKTFGVRKKFPHLNTLLILSYLDNKYLEDYTKELDKVKPFIFNRKQTNSLFDTDEFSNLFS